MLVGDRVVGQTGRVDRVVSDREHRAQQREPGAGAIGGVRIGVRVVLAFERPVRVDDAQGRALGTFAGQRELVSAQIHFLADVVAVQEVLRDARQLGPIGRGLQLLERHSADRLRVAGRICPGSVRYRSELNSGLQDLFVDCDLDPDLGVVREDRQVELITKAEVGREITHIGVDHLGFDVKLISVDRARQQPHVEDELAVEWLAVVVGDEALERNESRRLRECGGAGEESRGERESRECVVHSRWEATGARRRDRW